MYAERIIHLTPNFMFDRLVLRQQMLERAGWLDCSNVSAPTVIMLKRDIGRFSAGEKLMWVCGSEDDMTAFQIFGDFFIRLGQSVRFGFCEPSVLGDLSVICSGIDFDSDEPTENEWMVRFPTWYYAYYKAQKPDAE